MRLDQQFSQRFASVTDVATDVCPRKDGLVSRRILENTKKKYLENILGKKCSMYIIQEAMFEMHTALNYASTL